MGTCVCYCSRSPNLAAHEYAAPEREPFQEGEAAAFCGRLRATNPYSPKAEADDYEAWAEGWENGHEQILLQSSSYP